MSKFSRKRKRSLLCLNKSKRMFSNKLHKKKKNKSQRKSQRKKKRIKMRKSLCNSKENSSMIGTKPLEMPTTCPYLTLRRKRKRLKSKPSKMRSLHSKKKCQKRRRFLSHLQNKLKQSRSQSSSPKHNPRKSLSQLRHL